jgi:hypothetical protein
MPNTLDDKNLEYITLKNNSDISQSLSWYILADKKKQYIFTEDIFLVSWERKQFLRLQTKLVLNNTNEEIYLYKPGWELLDEVSYKKSIKWEFLTFEEINNGWQENIISQETYISWEIFISDEVVIVIETVIVEEILILEIPDVIYSLQRPSYIMQSGSTDIYYCDNEKDVCKVNFDVRNSFSGNFSKNDYECDINFWIWVWTWQEWRCNPNTVTFPRGEFIVQFRIWHKDDVTIFSEKSLYIKNIKKVAEQVVEKSDIFSWWETIGSQVDEEISLSKIYIRRPRIIIQSWVTWKWRYFHCEKAECKMNLNYEKRHTDERCLWSFAHMDQSSSSTHTRCNPGYITVLWGVHEMSLKVYEDDNEENQKKIRFYVYNEVVVQENPLIENLTLTLSLEKREQIDQKFEIKILLQWKISKEKTLLWSTLICKGVEKCYVNVEWIISSWDDIWEYIWSLDWKEFSQKLNPSWIWVEWIWVHEIIFSFEDIYQKFHINILKSPILETWINIWETEESNGVETIEETQKIDFTQNFLTLKYDGLRISWKAPIWSTIEIYNKDKKILEWFVDKKWKYRLVSKSLIPWEYIFDTKIYLESWEEILLKSSWDFTLLWEKRAYWFIPPKTKRISAKKIKVKKASNLIIYSEVFDSRGDILEKLPIGIQIFLTLIISLSAIFAVLHIVLSQMPPIIWNSFAVFHLRYAVKSQVLLYV